MTWVLSQCWSFQKCLADNESQVPFIETAFTSLAPEISRQMPLLSCALLSSFVRQQDNDEDSIEEHCLGTGCASKRDQRILRRLRKWG